MKNILYLPSPLVELTSVFFNKKEVNVWIKREDLIHPHLSGNKWRKLEFNLKEMRRQQKKGILTYRDKEKSTKIYQTRYPDHYILPEG